VWELDSGVDSRVVVLALVVADTREAVPAPGVDTLPGGILVEVGSLAVDRRVAGLVLTSVTTPSEQLETQKSPTDGYPLFS
jgi:hypothetical protein